MNKNEFQAIMIRNGDNQRILAEKLGISLSRLNAKINGTAGASFKLDEIARIKQRYSLSADTIDTILLQSDYLDKGF